MQPKRRKPTKSAHLDADLATEAKAIVALAFRNGPIEDLHAGTPCPTCQSDPKFSHVSDTEMTLIMQNAVDHVYRLLWQRTNDPAAYADNIRFGQRYTTTWNDPAV